MKEDKIIRFGDNSFDWIRLIAALSVMWGHAVVHLEINVHPIVDAIRGFFPGVILLFVMSSYLGFASYERNIQNGNGIIRKSGGVLNYIESRFLRVYPALWVAFIVSVITILEPVHTSNISTIIAK